MKPILRIAAVFAGVAVTAAVVALVQAQPGNKSGSVVKVKARLEKAAGKEVVVVTFDVQKPWHIYANPVGNEEFDASQTTINVVGKMKPKVTVDYPAGKDYVLMGTKLKIYDGTFEIRANIERTGGAGEPLEAIVRISACDDKSCLLPEAVRIPLK
jgi:hypothetical protein